MIEVVLLNWSCILVRQVVTHQMKTAYYQRGKSKRKSKSKLIALIIQISVEIFTIPESVKEMFDDKGIG